MNLYISTSRKPSRLTRKLSRWLAALLNAYCENRGKRSVADCVERARARGLTRLLFVYEKKGNPSELAFLDARGGRGSWLEPSVVLKSVVVPERSTAKRLCFTGVKATAVDAAGKKIAELFGFEGEGKEAGEGIEVVLSAREVFFRACGKRIGPVIKVSGFRKKGSDASD